MRIEALSTTLLLLTIASTAEAHRFSAKVVDVEQTRTGLVVAASDGIEPTLDEGCQLEPRPIALDGARSWWVICTGAGTPRLHFSQLGQGIDEIVLRFRPERGTQTWTRLHPMLDAWSPPPLVRPTKPARIEADRLSAGLRASFFQLNSWLVLASLLLLRRPRTDGAASRQAWLATGAVFIASHSVALAVGAFGLLPKTGWASVLLASLSLALPAAAVWVARAGLLADPRDLVETRAAPLFAVLGIALGVGLVGTLGSEPWNPNALASFHVGIELGLFFVLAILSPLHLSLERPRLRATLLYGLGLCGAASFGLGLARSLGAHA